MLEVLVVGAGPVGLTFASELARHGARCRIIDRLEQPSPYCRAIGVTPRTLEVWEDMGVAREMIDAGLWLTGLRTIFQGRPPMDAVADYSILPYSELGLPQYETERILERHLSCFGITVDRDCSLTGLSQDADGVSVQLAGPGDSVEESRFRYVVGCDGAHSTVRHALNLAFEGEAMPMTFMLGDVHLGLDLPYGVALRALRLHEDAAPDLFVAIPLPERGRYRVSMIAPEGLVPAGMSGHGIQAEARGPDLQQLQAVADDLLPDRPALTSLRWSSIFRISMRLVEHYGIDRVFLAGDAAHIHPPTGGQGMNTGIQDAYNLAWKLALVVLGSAPATLLGSYEAERRPVGAEVIARTLAATESYGREASGKPDRLANTQIRVSYRGSDWVRDDGDGVEATDLAAGDRAPDAAGLRRHGVGFPFRLFDVFRGTEHVLIAYMPGDDDVRELAVLAGFARELRSWLGPRLRVVAITAHEIEEAGPGVALYHDCERTFAEVYGGRAASYLVRPDGYLGWHGRSWRDPGLLEYLRGIFHAKPAHP